MNLLEGTREDKVIESVTSILKILQLVTDFPKINEFEINPLRGFEEG